MTERFSTCAPGPLTSAATSQQPTDNQPATTNEEGKKAKKEKLHRFPVDPRFASVAAGFYDAYEKAVGSKYARTDAAGDSAVFTKLLAALDPAGYPPVKIISVARAALARSRDRYAKACKLAATLRGFCRSFNEIRAELEQSGPADGRAGPARSKRTQADPTGEEISAWLQTMIPFRPLYQSKLGRWLGVDDLPPSVKDEFLEWWRGTKNSSLKPDCAPCPGSPETNLPPFTNHNNPQSEPNHEHTP